MTERELMAAKYAGTAFAILYTLPPRDRQLTPKEIAQEAQKEKNRVAAALHRQKIAEKNRRYREKMKGASDMQRANWTI